MKKLTCFLALAIACVLTCGAQDATVGDWTFGTATDGTPYTYTMNESGGVFGQWCDGTEGSCFWVVASTSRCADNVQYPVIVNGATTSFAATFICSGTVQLSGKTHYRYVLSPFDSVQSAVMQGARIGIAIPMTGEEFRVLRFSLNGAAFMSQKMDSAKLIFWENKSKKSTRDLRL